MAVLLQLEDGNPEQARSVGAGMSPGDGTYGEPYFYVSPWPYPEQNVLPALKGKGFWHTEGFTAAVLTAKTILEHADRPQTIHTFVLGTLESLIEIMRTQGKSRDAK